MRHFCKIGREAGIGTKVEVEVKEEVEVVVKEKTVSSSQSRIE